MNNCFFCEKPEPCGCDLSSYGQSPVGAPKQPYEGYKEDFLESKKTGFADRLFAACKKLPSVRPKTKQSDFKVPLLRLRMPLFARDPDMVVAPTMNQGQLISFADAPAEIRELADILDAEIGRQIDHLSLNGYENERDIINWHQHREDDCRDARVLIVSLGDERTFGLRPVCEKGRLCGKGNEAVCNGYGCTCKVCRAAKAHRRTNCKVCHDRSRYTLFQPKHGSLINLPNEFNSTHEHAVLADKTEKMLRISINTNAGENYEPRKYWNSGSFSKTPRVYSIKRKHPQDAIYVSCACLKKGCKCHADDIKAGSMYGNSYKPREFWGHAKCPIGKDSPGKTAVENYREKLDAKWKSNAPKDVAWKERAIKELRGKNLLCWCLQPEDVDGVNVTEPEGCHGRVLFEYVNREEGKPGDCRTENLPAH